MSHSTLLQHDSLGGVFAVVATFSAWLCAEIARGDAFLHGVASIATGAAACLSIYFTLKNRRK